MLKYLFLTACILALTACSGIRVTEESYMTHAESFNILFLQIPPRDTKERALELVPEGAEITTLDTMPNDLTSFISILNRIIGIDFSKVEGSLSKDE
ncbi:MAG: tRNA modification GTPase [Gammaproteobacteria bacterium]|nr:tRNA modification GTPase [Gammaproteobacteria bacterium]